MQEQSNKQFYISDWHYGHANVIAFDNRPFKSLLEMDEALVDRWNAVVSPGDIVYVLGDIMNLGIEQGKRVGEILGDNAVGEVEIVCNLG